MTTSEKIPYELTNLDDTRFRDLFENNSDGIYVSTVEGKVIDVNKAALDITGFTSKKEFAKQNTGDHYVNPRDRKKFHREIKKHGFVKDFEVTLKRKTGIEVICLLTSSALRNARGKVIGYQGIIRDVTEQRRKQKVQETLLKITQAATSSGDLISLLKQLHKELSQLINVDNFYVALYDEETKAYSFPYYADEFDKINEFEQMTLKKSLTDYVRRSGKALYVDEKKRKKLKKKGIAVMVGTQSPVWLGSPLITSEGVIGVVVVQSYKDEKLYSKEDLELLVFVSGQIARVIEQRQTDESIRLSEKRFRDLFEGSPDAIFVEDLDGVVLDANPAASKLHGLPYSEIVGNSFINLIPEKMRGEVQSNSDNFFKNGMVSLESHSLGKNGKVIPVEIKVSHIDYAGKDVLLLHVRDISSRKEAEEELQNSHEQLRRLSAHQLSIKEEESKRIARDLHDGLGQILTALKFDISMLDRQLEEQAPDSKAFKPIKKKTKSMISKVDSTIDAMRRISANLRPVVLDDIGLNAALEWLAGDFKKRSKINCSINLGRQEELVSDKEAATSLYRIIQETFTNIIKHAKAKNVTLSMVRDGDHIILTISDDGIGIDKRAMKKPGSYGLIGIQERVRGLGGTFEIEGKKGIGTTNKVVIPAIN